MGWTSVCADVYSQANCQGSSSRSCLPSFMVSSPATYRYLNKYTTPNGYITYTLSYRVYNGALDIKSRRCFNEERLGEGMGHGTEQGTGWCGQAEFKALEFDFDGNTPCISRCVDYGGITLYNLVWTHVVSPDGHLGKNSGGLSGVAL